MAKITRRGMLKLSSQYSGLLAVGLPLFGAGKSNDTPSTQEKLKVIVAGGHPDDPESGCGGTIARYTDLGHDVVILYLTRGEAGIKGKSNDEAAAIRSAECQQACSILKARPLYAGQIDGATEVTPVRYDEFRSILVAERPDIVFTHWPIDSHRDHRTVSYLVYDAWLKGRKKFDLYYFEVEQGQQTQNFHPTNYVDITQTEPRKRAACYAHASQDPVNGFYPSFHEKMNRFRGMECGCELAEAFVRHCQSPASAVPGI
jgi:LmbE family N-acetylglucosaminyl deacetylase